MTSPRAAARPDLRPPTLGRTLPAAERRALRRAVALLDLDRRGFLWAVLAGSAALGSAVALSATAAWLIARASQMPSVLALSVASVAVRTFGISRALLRYLERLASHRVALRGMATLREGLYRTLADGRPDGLAGVKRGDLLVRTGADVDAVGDVVVRALLPAAVAAVVGVGSVVLVGWLHLGIGAVLAVCLASAGLVGPWLSMRSARLSEHAQTQARGELGATAMTLVDGAAELTVSNRVSQVITSLRGTEASLASAKDAAARPDALAAGVDVVAMGVAVLAALALGIPATVAGTMEQVELAVVVLTPLAAFEGTALLGPAAVQLIRSAGSAVRIIDLLDAAAARTVPAATGATSATAAPLTGRARSLTVDPGPHLAARDLAIGWPEGPVLAAGVRLDVTPGRSIAVVGPSGVGKTTLLLTLAGLLPPKDGTATLSRTPVWGMGRGPLSEHVIFTAEDAHVFETTVLENLRVARGDVTEAEAVALLDRAGLREWLAGLPAGLATVVGADGSSVSGGERRRLLLARALASPARVLLLDEPGEHLDPATADRLMEDLLRAGRPAPGEPTGDHRASPRGVVLATHRLTGLHHADEILLLGHPERQAADVPSPKAPARVLARGTHAELLATVPAYRWALEQESRRPHGHAQPSLRHVGP
ncbi:thiol reductant ABC exporter subunit CydC [Cellulomonas fimi]|uniref:Thiol reductant ABC exporter subunit CydC n=1 Tax=Cellulomonas fimi TaxID=1708 RepID=A0A7Y0LX13_CELFI|nr:thiol reductant ABC exporter subunit CydC [Cellulomonas fimi]NMR19479.1 thiol reductant ABC exporter subunit CydC [Cellulomonas fimi]